MDEIMKTAKRKKFARVCPNCKSSDASLTDLVGSPSSNLIINTEGDNPINSYKCAKCEYIGAFPKIGDNKLKNKI